jgi:hypothetical protein
MSPHVSVTYYLLVGRTGLVEALFSDPLGEVHFHSHLIGMNIVHISDRVHGFYLMVSHESIYKS